MKRIFLLLLLLGLGVSACLPASSPPREVFTPVSELDLQGTAAILSHQTLQALPTTSSIPSQTAAIVTPTQTAPQASPTETGIPALLTLTATLLAGTPTGGTVTAATDIAAPFTGTPEAPNAAPPAGSPQPLSYGTLPPNLPYGTINLFNKAHVDVYISLRCVTKEGYVTILEYPVKKTLKASAPAGNYTYIAWVGGRQFDGSFAMEKDGFIAITFFNNRINVKKN